MILTLAAQPRDGTEEVDVVSGLVPYGFDGVVGSGVVAVLMMAMAE